MRQLQVLILATAVLMPKPTCEILKLQPHISQAPLRYIRFTAVIEDRGGGEVRLIGGEGLETSSLVQAGARTTQIEWKNVVLAPGEYEVQLIASRCTARERLIVAGGDGH